MPHVYSFYPREVVWCNFEVRPAAQPPEFIGEHPVVILSIRNNEKWPHLVVPLTTAPQVLPDPSIVQINKKFVPTGRNSYAICSHIYSASHSRLRRPYRKMRLTDDLFDAIKEACCHRLPFQPSQKP